jgi:hypothetical protein
VQKRLSQKKHDGGECREAITGKSLPVKLEDDVAHLCIIRGIRCHESSGLSAQNEGLCSLDGRELFVRASNEIMNNAIKLITDAPELLRDELPYWICYPTFPSC